MACSPYSNLKVNMAMLTSGSDKHMVSVVLWLPFSSLTSACVCIRCVLRYGQPPSGWVPEGSHSTQRTVPFRSQHQPAARRRAWGQLRVSSHLSDITVVMSQFKGVILTSVRVCVSLSRCVLLFRPPRLANAFEDSIVIFRDYLTIGSLRRFIRDHMWVFKR